MKKILYEKPTMLTFEVRVGRCLCLSDVQATSASRGSYGDVFDDLDEED